MPNMTGAIAQLLVEDVDHTGHAGFQVFLRSLFMVGIAELFDKTWFMGLLLALKYTPATVFVGSFLSLFLHTILAAAFGYAFARLLKPYILNFLAAGLFLLFAILYSRDCWRADKDSDVIASGREEAAEDCDLEPSKQDSCESIASAPEEGKVQAEAPAYGAAKAPQKARRSRFAKEFSIFLKAFLAVFIAEWGDRTQIAMIGQHASQPLIPVFLGSVVAFFLLTLSAVGVAHVLTDQKLSERVVYAVSATCFFVFAALALKDALIAFIHRGDLQSGHGLHDKIYFMSLHR